MTLDKMKIAVWKLTRNMDKIATMLSCSNKSVRQTAMETINKFVANSEKKYSILEQALGNSSYDVRIWAVQALGQLDDKRAIDPLLRMLKNGYSPAGEALERLGASKEQMINAYIAVVSSNNIAVSSDIVAVSEAINSLADLGDKRAIKPLLGQLQNGHSDVRSSAETALAKLGTGKEQLVDGYIAVLSSALCANISETLPTQ